MKRFDQTFLFKQHLYTIKLVLLIWVSTSILPMYNIFQFFIRYPMSLRILVSFIYIALLLALTLIILIKQKIYLDLACKAYDSKTYQTGILLKGKMNDFLNIHSVGIKENRGKAFTFLSNESLISQIAEHDLCYYVITKRNRLIIIDTFNKKETKHE